METVKAFPAVIKLNIGGWKFTSKLSTLKKAPVLSTMFCGTNDIDQDEDGCYFIDRNGKFFGHILEYLRDDKYLPPKEVLEDVIKDAEYFNLSKFADRLKGLPPLFPFDTVHKDNRTINRNYFDLLEQVKKLAKAGAPNGKTKDFVDSVSQVVVRTVERSPYNKTSYLQNMLTRGSQKRYVESLHAVHKLLAGKYYENVTLFTEKDYIENFEGFIHTLLYDLRQEGYSVTLLSEPTAKSSAASRLEELKVGDVVFDNYEYVANDCAILQFTWFYPKVEKS